MVRGDEKMSLEIEFEGTPAERNESDSADSEVLEFAVRDQTYMDGITTRWPDDSEGVVVTEVTGGGWASLAGLRQGDLVVSINDELVPDTEAFTAAIDSIESTRPDIVKIFVVRAYRTTFVFLEPEWPADAGS